MKQKNNLFVVIPAYNEEKVIKSVISDLKKEDYKNIIVVDDGSKDKTSEIAKKEKVTTIRHIINRGQGAALRTGIDYALSKGADIIFTFDADGQHQAKDIKRLIKPILDKKYDVALGSRFIGKGMSNVPFFRRFILKLGALVLRIMYGAKLTDSHNGFRALSRKAAEKIKITSNGMEHASEIIEEIMRNKLRYIEIPVTIKYTEYSKLKGQSSLNAFKILFKMLIKRFIR